MRNSFMRKTCAFILTTVMVLGSCVPAAAAEIEGDSVIEYSGMETSVSGDEEVSEIFGNEAEENVVAPADMIPDEAGEMLCDEPAGEPVQEANDSGISHETEEVIDPEGYVYYPKDQYDLVFTAYNNGKVKTLTYKISKSASETKLSEYLKSIGKYNEVFPSMGGFIDTASGDVLTGWSVVRDGVADYGYYGEGEVDDYWITPGGDYHFTARICRKVSDSLYVYITPRAIYDGRAHVNTGQKSSASVASDIEIEVIALKDETGASGQYILKSGTDYSISFKNNVEPSMKMNEDGSYTALYSDDSKRPYAEIVGKGNFAGYSARAYFDILPFNFSTDWPRVRLEGLKRSYALKGGKLSAKIDPKANITWSFWSGNKYADKKVVLKNGVDYSVRLYRYDTGSGVWRRQSYDPNSISQSGDYLYTIWGMGKYCGVAYDNSWLGEFNDGTSGTITPAHYSFAGSTEPADAAYQFRVDQDDYRDISKASISVKKSSIKFDGKFHTADDFGITVSIGSGSEKRNLTEGTDFTVTYDGNDFPYISSRTSVSGVGYIYNSSICNAVYESKIGIANKYKITINAIEGSGYYGSKTDKTVTISGLALSAGGFAKTKPLNFTGQNQSVGVSVKRSYMRKGLTYKNLSELGYDSNGKCNYLDNINSNPAYYAQKSFGFASDYYNAAPGNYSTVLFPIGGGVTHGKAVKLTFKRKKTSIKDAVNKGYLAINIEPGVYNAGGAMPGAISVTLLGDTSSGQKIRFSGDEIYSPYVNRMFSNFTVKVSNNKKAGDGAIVTLGGSSLFTGSYNFKYSIKPLTLTQDTIPVINGDSWYKDQGKIIPNFLSSTEYAEGQLVALISDAKKKSGSLKPAVKVYQTYYKNPADAGAGKLSLAELSNKQYSLETTEINGSCTFKVNFSGTPLVTGFEKKILPVEGVYADFDEAAKIIEATVVYKGKTYNFDPSSKISLPYEGRQIRFDRSGSTGTGVVSVKLSDGTVLGKDDFSVEYGDNLAAKNNGGSFKVTLKHNNTTGSFKYGGSATFKFTITPADKLNL